MSYKLFKITNCDISRITLLDECIKRTVVFILKKLMIKKKYKKEIETSMYNGSNVHIIKDLLQSFNVNIDMMITETLLDDSKKKYVDDKQIYIYEKDDKLHLPTLMKFFNKITSELKNNECTIASFYNRTGAYNEKFKQPVYYTWNSHTVILHKYNSILYLYDPQLKININVETNLNDVAWLKTRITVKTIYYNSTSLKTNKSPELNGKK